MKPKIITVADIWKSYNNEVLPADATETHRIETKRSFYAGFNAAFYMTLDKVSDQQKRVWEEELNTFVEMVRGGLA